ncbi:hypothetical protein GS474_23895 [Rhodococcus hoagii]|nr:hypothetical protein [Prescottella equi]
MTVFATATDVGRGRRPFNDDEKIDIEAMIAAAGKWIQDRRIESGKPELPATDPTAQLVVVQVVRTAFDMAKHAGLSSFSKATGGVSRSGTIANPGELLVFTEFHRKLLGISLSAKPSYTFGD